jgi:hypothetical protein
MTNNLRLSAPDIPFRAVSIDSNLTVNRFNEIQNSIAGPCYTLTRLQNSTLGTSWLIDYDLGENDSGDITQFIDHLIIGRADIMQDEAGIRSVEIFSSNDGISYLIRTITDITNATLYGPNSDILLVDRTDNPLTFHRYWRIRFNTDTLTRFYFSKLFFGQAFVLGVDQDPVFCELNRERSRDVDFVTSSGAVHSTKAAELPYRLRVRWDGVSDAKVLEFQEQILEFQNLKPLYVWTTDNHEILENLRVVPMKITRSRVTKEYDNWSQVSLEMEECL